VWMKLDTNSDSTLTVRRPSLLCTRGGQNNFGSYLISLAPGYLQPEEFLAECLDESYCSMAEAMEAYEIIRDQHDELPVENLGDAIRAIGLNPTSQQVTVSRHVDLPLQRTA
jgi:hypothetical protein